MVGAGSTVLTPPRVSWSCVVLVTILLAARILRRRSPDGAPEPRRRASILLVARASVVAHDRGRARATPRSSTTPATGSGRLRGRRRALGVLVPATELLPQRLRRRACSTTSTCRRWQRPPATAGRRWTTIAGPLRRAGARRSTPADGPRLAGRRQHRGGAERGVQRPDQAQGRRATPRTRSRYTPDLMRSTTSGTMLAQLLRRRHGEHGVRDADRACRCRSSTPQMMSPYQMLIPDYAAFPSAVGHAKAARARADRGPPLHDLDVQARRRSTRSSASRSSSPRGRPPDPSTSTRATFISDESAFDEVRSARSTRRDSPLLVNLVTMQNHFPMKDLLRRPSAGRRRLTANRRTRPRATAAACSYTDEACAKFIARLEASDEKTAVVFYGDHQPAFWPEDVRERERRRWRCEQTPFFMWANFPTCTSSRPRP